MRLEDDFFADELSDVRLEEDNAKRQMRVIGREG